MKLYQFIFNKPYIKHAYFRFLEFLFRYKFFNAKTYIKLQFKIRNKYKCNLRSPFTLSEKLQWLKLNQINPEYTQLVDKVKFKEFIKNKIGEEYVVPSLGFWDRVEDIDFANLPNEYFIKCNHGSGKRYTFIVDETTDKKLLIKKLKKGIKCNHFYHGAEYPYKNIEKKIIAEKIMQKETPGGWILRILPDDYKIHCFNGKPQLIQIDQNRFLNHQRNFYNTEWEKLNLKVGYPNFDDFILPAKVLQEKLLSIASELSSGIPFVRIDFYIVDNKIYVGEMTFFPDAGYINFDPPEWDAKLGELLYI